MNLKETFFRALTYIPPGAGDAILNGASMFLAQAEQDRLPKPSTAFA